MKAIETLAGADAELFRAAVADLVAADAAGVQAGTDGDRYVTPAAFRAATAPVALASVEGETAVDFAAGRNFVLVLEEDTELGDPVNVAPGDSGTIYLIQDGAGEWEATFAENWKPLGDLTGDDTPGAVNVYSYFARAADAITVAWLGAEG